MKSSENDDGARVEAPARGCEIIANRTAAQWQEPKLIGIAADHGGFELKQYLVEMLRRTDCRVIDFGSRSLDTEDDYPDSVVPLARAVSQGQVFRGVAICGSGVGVCVAANKLAGVRACLLHDTFSAHRGVEDDDLNVICLGGLVVDHALAWELVQTFLAARFTGADRHLRRLAKVSAVENRVSSEPPWPGPLKVFGARLLSRIHRGL